MPSKRATHQNPCTLTTPTSPTPQHSVGGGGGGPRFPKPSTLNPKPSSEELGKLWGAGGVGFRFWALEAFSTTAGPRILSSGGKGGGVVDAITQAAQLFRNFDHCGTDGFDRLPAAGSFSHDLTRKFSEQDI